MAMKSIHLAHFGLKWPPTFTLKHYELLRVTIVIKIEELFEVTNGN